MHDLIFTLLTNEDYSCYGWEDIFKAKNIKVKNTNNKWKFTIMNPYQCYSQYVEYESNHSMEKYNSNENDMEEIYTDEFLEFGGNQLEDLLKKLASFKGYFDDDGIQRLRLLFDCNYCGEFIDKWYLNIIEHNDKRESVAMPWWRFGIFGKINKSVLSKGFIQSYEDVLYEITEENVKFDDDIHVFMVFIIDLWIPHG